MNNKIKIAFLINYITNGGPSNVVLNLINGLDKNIFDIFLITFFNENNKEIIKKLQNNNIKVINCDIKSRKRVLLTGKKILEKIIINNQIQIIHSHGFIPDIVSSNIKKIKSLSTIHNNILEDYKNEYGRLKAIMYYTIHLHFLKRINKCVCCSESVYNVLKSKIKDCTFIRNGIANTSIDKIITRESLKIKDTDIVFIYVGVINTRKNVKKLCELFKNTYMPNEYLLIVGDGPEKSKCEEIKCNNIIFIGYDNSPVNYMNISNIYVSASKAEGFSISILEALDNGLNLLLSDIPSHREIINIDENINIGTLFLEKNFEKKKMEIVNNLNSKEIIKNYKNQYLSDKEMVGKYKKIYEEL